MTKSAPRYELNGMTTKQGMKMQGFECTHSFVISTFYFLAVYSPMKVYKLFHATHGRRVDTELT